MLLFSVVTWEVRNSGKPIARYLFCGLSIINVLDCLRINSWVKSIELITTEVCSIYPDVGTKKIN